MGLSSGAWEPEQKHAVGQSSRFFWCEDAPYIGVMPHSGQVMSFSMIRLVNNTILAKKQR